MRKVPASALYFVLIISLIVLVLISTFISFIYFQRQYFSTYEGEKRVNDNIHYAEILFANDEAFRTNLRDSITFDLFGLGDDTVQLRQSDWGLFKLIKVKAHYKNTSRNRVMLYANALSDTDTINCTLYLRDKKNILSLAGNTKISGICYLPKAGVKPAIVEGKPFQGKKLIDGEIKNSTSLLPLLDSTILKQAIKLFDSTYLKEKFAPYVSISVLEGNIAQSFSNNPKVYISKTGINIRNTNISGHCILYSSKELNIYSDASLSDVILIAPIVRLKKGFKGNVQIFAKDTLLIEAGVKLSYPSILFAYQTKENDSKISLENDVSIIGTILSVDESVDDKNGRIVVAKGVVIKGNIWCEGYLDFNGTIEGGIVAHKFIMNTTATIYENHLLDVSINKTLRSNKFLYPSMFFSKKVSLLKALK
jgi:hypothetical protein